MLFFEENIFYPVDHKQDSIKISNDLTIHYKISSFKDNSRWYIAVTLENKGEVILRKDLSKSFEKYGMVVDYITVLPAIIQSKTDTIEYSDKMAGELNTIMYKLQADLDLLKEFRRRYNI